jgi:hypothetical protein
LKVQEEAGVGGAAADWLIQLWIWATIVALLIPQMEANPQWLSEIRTASREAAGSLVLTKEMADWKAVLGFDEANQSCGCVGPVAWH